jgi:hypothetical protein
VSRRILVGRRALAVPGVLFVFLALGTLLLSGCGSSGSEATGNASNTTTQTTEETTTKEAVNVVVRVSGTQGTAYTGAYGPFTASKAVDGVLEAEPTDYEVKAADNAKGVFAVFRKTQPADEGTLRVEILANGEVVAQDETSEEFGVVNASWSSQGRTVVERPGER